MQLLTQDLNATAIGGNRCKWSGYNDREVIEAKLSPESILLMLPLRMNVNEILIKTKFLYKKCIWKLHLQQDYFVLASMC